MIVWFYEGSDTIGKRYRLGYDTEDPSSLAIYEEIKEDWYET